MKTPIPFRALAMVAAIASISLPAIADEQRDAYRKFASPEALSARVALVPSGAARIDAALGQIIPAPYRIMLDSSVVPSMVITWPAGDNWMEVLAIALSPPGLVVIPDWTNNSMTVTWRRRGQVQPRVEMPGPERVGRITGGFTAHSADLPATGQIVSDVAPEERSPKPPKTPAAKAKPEPEDGLTITPGSGGGGEGEKTKIRVGRYSIPSGKDMWALMQAAVNGHSIAILGFSGADTEQGRIKWANMHADNLKQRLVQWGFPKERIQVRQRLGDEKYQKADSAYCYIILSEKKGSGDEK